MQIDRGRSIMSVSSLSPSKTILFTNFSLFQKQNYSTKKILLAIFCGYSVHCASLGIKRERERERGVLRSWINHLAQMAENMFLKGNVRSLKYLNDEGNIERVKILFEQFRNLRFYPHRNICDLFIHFRMYLIDLV